MQDDGGEQGGGRSNEGGRGAAGRRDEARRRVAGHRHEGAGRGREDASLAQISAAVVRERYTSSPFRSSMPLPWSLALLLHSSPHRHQKRAEEEETSVEGIDPNGGGRLVVDAGGYRMVWGERNAKVS